MNSRTFGTLARTCASVLVLIGLAGACRGPSGPLTGAASPRAAVDQFMGAVRAQDLQALSTIWGTTEGPARDRMSRPELERRELLMMCYLAHDRFVVQQEQPAAAGARVYRVELTRGTVNRPSTFTTVRGPSDRWYVSDADLTQLQAFCDRPR